MSERAISNFVEAELAEGLDEIPLHMHEGITEYVLRGRPVGHFLRALLTGATLVEVVNRADVQNLAALKAWASLLYNTIPGCAWGSKEAVRAWIKQGGLLGSEPDA